LYSHFPNCIVAGLSRLTNSDAVSDNDREMMVDLTKRLTLEALCGDPIKANLVADEIEDVWSCAKLLNVVGNMFERPTSPKGDFGVKRFLKNLKHVVEARKRKMEEADSKVYTSKQVVSEGVAGVSNMNSDKFAYWLSFKASNLPKNYIPEDLYEDVDTCSRPFSANTTLNMTLPRPSTAGSYHNKHVTITPQANKVIKIENSLNSYGDDFIQEDTGEDENDFDQELAMIETKRQTSFPQLTPKRPRSAFATSGFNRSSSNISKKTGGRRPTSAFSTPTAAKKARPVETKSAKQMMNDLMRDGLDLHREKSVRHSLSVNQRHTILTTMII
jgi:hypothetical protein